MRFIFCFGICLMTMAAAGPLAAADRFLDTDQYVEMKDGKRAAELLLEDAQRRGMDIDDARTFEPRRTMGVPAGWINVGEADSVVSCEGLETVVVLMLMVRSTSLREFADLLAKEVRIRQYVSGGAIVSLPTAYIDSLRSKPFAGWIGPYLPEYKYEHRPFEGSQILVVALFGNDDENMSDLRTLGTRPENIKDHFYMVPDGKRMLEPIARLKWVYRIDLPVSVKFDD